MGRYPKHITEKLARNKDYYSLSSMENIERCKIDPDYLGDVMLVNERLIWHSIHKYIGNPDVIVKGNSVEKDDILQLGRMGFVKSIKAFDTTRGVKFSSFAVTAIVREIRCFLRDSAKIIRPTRAAIQLINQLNRIETELGHTPSVEELTEMLGEDEAKIIKALQAGKPVRYLDETVNYGNEEQQVTLLDMLDSSSDVEEGVLDRVYVDAILDALKDRLSGTEVNVLRMRMNGFTQAQAATQENISQVKVSRIMRKIANIVKERPEIYDLMSST